MENKILNEYEYLNCELEDLKEMVWLLEEDCFNRKIDKLEKWEVYDKYRMAQIMVNSIWKILYHVTKESNEFINKIYKEKQSKKEGVAQ